MLPEDIIKRPLVLTEKGNALREALKRDKRVQSFHDAVPYEGGHGVTVVHLK